jgi:hypothetical protein
MKHSIHFLTAIVLVSGAVTATAQAADKVPLVIDYPAPTTKDTPDNQPKIQGVEPPRPSYKKPDPLQVPPGCANLALGKPVTSSVAPFSGELVQITDGKREPVDEQAVEFKKGVQWTQVDLGRPSVLQVIALWNDHRYTQVYRDVIVQVSDDAEFKTGVSTLFNNDTDNSAGFGVGKDTEFFETRWGRLIDAGGVTARYVRVTTRGSNRSALNCRQEIEVYGIPPK